MSALPVPTEVFQLIRLLVLVQGLSALLALLGRLGAPGFCWVLRLLHALRPPSMDP